MESQSARSWDSKSVNHSVHKFRLRPEAPEQDSTSDSSARRLVARSADWSDLTWEIGLVNRLD